MSRAAEDPGYQDDASRTSDTSDDDPDEKRSSNILKKLPFIKKSPKISGIVNPSALDTASNASTSDDEQLKEKPPKTKRLSLKKKEAPTGHREFENPCYGSAFELESRKPVPTINTDKTDDGGNQR